MDICINPWQNSTVCSFGFSFRVLDFGFFKECGGVQADFFNCAWRWWTRKLDRVVKRGACGLQLAKARLRAIHLLHSDRIFFHHSNTITSWWFVTVNTTGWFETNHVNRFESPSEIGRLISFVCRWHELQHNRLRLASDAVKYRVRGIRIAPRERHGVSLQRPVQLFPALQCCIHEGPLRSVYGSGHLSLRRPRQAHSQIT